MNPPQSVRLLLVSLLVLSMVGCRGEPASTQPYSCPVPPIPTDVSLPPECRR